ncbi:MAG: phosphatase PAP2 family protein [Catenulispora sp.]|nr:phosphatase PAP2 family protein [Catenulispora sp.]
MTESSIAAPPGFARRRFLLSAAGIGAGVATVGTVDAGFAPTASAAGTATGGAADAVAGAAAADPMLPFVDHYATNATTNPTALTNAAVDILSGMARLWRPGTAWDNGSVVDREVLRANVRHCVQVTRRRSQDAAKKAFFYDRQDQSYAAIGGLGPLAELYKQGALAVTSITSAPDGTPPAQINDVVPEGAPPGAATGAGSPTSELGAVVQLVQALRGAHSSGNPSKLAYGYPRPWRLTEDSVVAPTGAVDEFGYPVYDSDVVVAPQLLRQRSLTPATDGGFPSGHTNAFFLASLALAYAVPERFQELVTRAYELADTRIVAGMHSPLDVIGGRVLGTALAAAILSDPATAQIKALARKTALEYFTARTGTTPDTLAAYAHSAGPAADPYADRAANIRAIAPRHTYHLPRRGGRTVPMVVPKGAEALLETRLPYLDAAQRREVLRTTALPSGDVLLDGPELWGRLDLFAAADGYGSFDADTRVVMDAADRGFSAADTWRNAIGGAGRLVKAGSGSLTLAGRNSYRGGTLVEAGTLVAASERAFGSGDVQVGERAGLGLAVGSDGLQDAELVVGGTLTVARTSSLTIQVDADRASRRHGFVVAIRARRVRGRFASVSALGLRSDIEYTECGVFVRLRPGS